VLLLHGACQLRYFVNYTYSSSLQIANLAATAYLAYYAYSCCTVTACVKVWKATAARKKRMRTVLKKLAGGALWRCALQKRLVYAAKVVSLT
jgi:hypothetical protein